jgi:hypothetical protein
VIERIVAAAGIVFSSELAAAPASDEAHTWFSVRVGDQVEIVEQVENGGPLR